MSTTSEKKPSFGWKEALIGGLITFAVTTVAGVAVWLFTKDPDKSERLSYSVDNPAVFSRQSKSIALQVATIRNDGLTKSEGVVVDVSVPKNVRVIDHSIKFSSSPSVPYTIKNSSYGFSIIIPNFLPKDRAAVSLLLSGSISKPLSFSVRSQQNIASIEPQVKNGTNTGISITVFMIVLSLSAVIQYAGTQYLSFRRFNVNKKRFYESISRAGVFSPGRNNIGFILMHNELLYEAEEVLKKDIILGTAELMTIAHYGAVMKLLDKPEYQSYISAAEWPGSDPHSKANILVDKFIIAACDNDAESARNAVKEAFKLNVSVSSYFSSSKLLCRLSSELGMEDFISREKMEAEKNQQK